MDKTNTNIEKILDSIKPMIISVCNKWKPTQRITREDLFQEGQKAAIEAIKKFDESYGIKFQTYAYKCISNAITAYYYSNCYTTHSSLYFQADKNEREFIVDQERRVLSINNSPTEEKNEIDIISPSGTIKELHKKEIIDKLKVAIEKLPKEEKYILENAYMFFGNKSLEQVGLETNTTRQGVSRKIKKIFSKLRSDLNISEEDLYDW